MDIDLAKVKTGLRNPRRAAAYLHMSAQQVVGKRLNYGVRPMEHEWDVLVVLDACRWDLFDAVWRDHSIASRIEGVKPVYACATATPEWLSRALDEAPNEEIAKTFFVAGNGHANTSCNTDRFYGYDPVWKYEHEEYGTVVPEIVTNAAIRAYREEQPDRLLAHYIQPHAPFLHCAGKYREYEGRHNTGQVWRELRHGRASESEVWEDYARNLETVLDHVEILLENVSGDVIITSDHGNGMGELGIYGHPLYALQPSLKRVPWATATGEGRETYTVRDESDIQEIGITDVEEHLRNLGYVG